MNLLTELSESLIAGDDERSAELTQAAIAEGLSPKSILDDGLLSGMTTIGDRFKAHDIFLPDVLLAARAMQAGMEHLKPLLIRDGIPSVGTVVFGTVQGDLHDIGKNLVGIMLRGAGFDVIDLGNDVSPEAFVDTATEKNASVIGMSALLTTTMTVMQKVVDLVKERELQGRIKVIVGGAPVTAAFAEEIGADAYGFDAACAVDRVKELAGAN